MRSIALLIVSMAFVASTFGQGRVELTAQTTTRSGLEFTLDTAATGGNSWDNQTQDLLLYVIHYQTDTAVLTIQSSILLDGLELPDRTINVPDSTSMIIGPFRNSYYAQEDATNSIDNAILFSMDTITNVFYAVIKPGGLN